ncbi:hypothetical protein C8F04DRAFT_1151413, partial [Mycena alexandri]
MPVSPHLHWYQFMLLTYFLFSSVCAIPSSRTRLDTTMSACALPYPYPSPRCCHAHRRRSPPLLFLALSWTVSISRMVGQAACGTGLSMEPFLEV